MIFLLIVKFKLFLIDFGEVFEGLVLLIICFDILIVFLFLIIIVNIGVDVINEIKLL